jgi:phage-related tail fiber protein
MANLLKIKRGTRAQLNAAVSGNTLNLGEPYLITDENRIAIGTGSNTYEVFAKTSELSSALDGDLVAIAALTGTGILKRTGTDTWSLDSSAYITGNQSISVTGDATGTGTTAIALTLASVGTAGTYTKVTTNAKGLVTAGTTLTATDIPTLTAAKISDFDTQVRTSTVAQLAAPAAALAMNSQKITGLADPTLAQDAATKAYVDGVAQGLDVKISVRAATTANITLSGTQTIDAVSVIAGDRVLVKNQTTTSENGIYIAAAGAWARSTDADIWGELVAAFTFVEEGTANADTGWVSTANAGGTIGVTAVAFTQFSGAGAYIAGTGLVLTGNTFDVVGTADRISVAADSIDIATTYTGQASITTLGTIATGTWNATAIGVTKGGLGLTAAITGLLKGDGTSYSAATAGTDYLNNSSTVDGGTF